ncbi:hypothetical protein [Idiomarina abyssalis]|nr:hypothetical protein [Idiomarina abyssalis]QZN92015.1 hypothetical protein K5X84_05815 [Idiomarina abyssalis]
MMLALSYAYQIIHKSIKVRFITAADLMLQLATAKKNSWVVPVTNQQNNE